MAGVIAWGANMGQSALVSQTKDSFIETRTRALLLLSGLKELLSIWYNEPLFTIRVAHIYWPCSRQHTLGLPQKVLPTFRHRQLNNRNDPTVEYLICTVEINICRFFAKFLHKIKKVSFCQLYCDLLTPGSNL